MLNKFLILILIGLIAACSGPAEKTGESVVKNKSDVKSEAGYYGEKINGENPVSGKEMTAMLEDNDSVYVTLKSKIVSNCQKSGCWMDLDLGNDEVVKVTFKDYAFFIPLDSKGKTATIEGVAKREIIPVDLLKHYAEDEGQSEEEIAAITDDEIAYTFEAVGVIIED